MLFFKMPCHFFRVLMTYYYDKMTDELDDRILDTMQKGVGIRPRLTELATELKEHRSTVNLRVTNLEKNGIIKGYRPELDWEKLGYDLDGYVGVICLNDSIKNLTGKIEKDKNVFGIWDISAGTFDLLIKCRFRNHQDIRELHDKIMSVDGVKDVDIWLLGLNYKEE